MRTASSAARRATRLEQEMGYGPAHGRRGAPANVSAVTERPLQNPRDRWRDARHNDQDEAERGEERARPRTRARAPHSPWLLKDRGVNHRYVLFLLVRDDATP